MNVVAALVYWVIVSVWLLVLGTIAWFYAHNPRAFGTTRLLLAVLAIDATRNVFENIYFASISAASTFSLPKWRRFWAALPFSSCRNCSTSSPAAPCSACC
jgi:hypothetical protein